MNAFAQNDSSVLESSDSQPESGVVPCTSNIRPVAPSSPAMVPSKRLYARKQTPVRVNALPVETLDAHAAAFVRGRADSRGEALEAFVFATVEMVRATRMAGDNLPVLVRGRSATLAPRSRGFQRTLSPAWDDGNEVASTVQFANDMLSSLRAQIR